MSSLIHFPPKHLTSFHVHLNIQFPILFFMNHYYTLPLCPISTSWWRKECPFLPSEPPLLLPSHPPLLSQSQWPVLPYESMVLPLPALLTALPLCRPLHVDAAASVQAPHYPAGAAAAVPGDPRPLPLRLLGPRPLPALCSGGELRQHAWGWVWAHHRRPQLHHEVRKGRRGGGRERGCLFSKSVY